MLKNNMLKNYKENLENSNDNVIERLGRKLNLKFKTPITEKNIKKRVNFIVKYEQKILKEEIKEIIEIKLGFVSKLYINKKISYYNFTPSLTQIIDSKYIYSFENDIEYTEYKKFIRIFLEIYEYNDFYKKLNRFNENKTKIIDFNKINKVSQIFEYQKIMKNQYKVLEKYFENTKFPNQLTDGTIHGFVHNLNEMSLELLLKGNNKFINPVSGNSFDSERGIYTTLKTSKCDVIRFRIHENFIALVFSKELVNDFGYIFNFDFRYGSVNNESYIKNKKYSAIERATKKLCREKYATRSHEVIFYTDHIKMKDYLEAIIFTDEKTFKLFKNMKGVKFKNKMRLIKEDNY